MNDWEVRVISETQQLRDRIKWLENGLKEIMKISKNMNISSDESRIVHIVQSTLDGEPTTADEHNCMIQYDENKEIAVDWKNREREEKIKKKTNMIQSIGYRGED